MTDTKLFPTHPKFPAEGSDAIYWNCDCRLFCSRMTDQIAVEPSWNDSSPLFCPSHNFGLVTQTELKWFAFLRSPSPSQTMAEWTILTAALA
jgi:hypothetical protein